MPYMNVTEVESALIGLAAAHPATCELITLPNLTVEGRTTHAVRIGTQSANSVDAYYLTGGVHAREWGSCEILVNLATDLCDAYAAGTGIGYGDKYYSAAEVKALVEQANVIIFPCVNPDGRNYSQNSAALWRKNRNPADSGGVASKIGIDINRNQDFLWNFNTAFDPGAINVYLGSSDPTQETYHGHAPHSEAETKNINYIHDTYTRIRWYVDVHSYSEDILYIWGDDESQVSDTSKNFQNPAFNDKRGLLGDDYREYLPDGDLSELTQLANAFTHSLGEVRGKHYVAKPGFSLYATSGTNDDYAYSRHLVDSSKSKALAFTVEWGTEFQPPWAEMQEIIKDVSAGLIGMGLEALGIDDFIVTDRDTFSSYEVETTASYDNAFYVIYDGFAPTALGLPGAAPAITFHDATSGSAIGSMSASMTSVELEDAGAMGTPQRVSFTFRVNFANGSAFTAETRDIYVQAAFAGMTDVALVRLIKQPNPYMVDGPVSWLSTDVRVFQLRPGHKANSSSSVTLANPNAVANAPFDYIQALLTELRGYGNAPAPPFENISQDEQTSQLELSRTVGGVRVLNFAVAKVRYRANTQDALTFASSSAPSTRWSPTSATQTASPQTCRTIGAPATARRRCWASIASSAAQATKSSRFRTSPRHASTPRARAWRPNPTTGTNTQSSMQAEQRPSSTSVAGLTSTRPSLSFRSMCQPGTTARSQAASRSFNWCGASISAWSQRFASSPVHSIRSPTVRRRPPAIGSPSATSRSLSQTTRATSPHTGCSTRCS